MWLVLFLILRSGESDAWRETRSFQTLEARHSHNLIAAVLMGRERLAIPPLVRERKDGSASVVVLHVGNDLCGHPGMVHGGLVATLFDQYLARLVGSTVEFIQSVIT